MVDASAHGSGPRWEETTLLRCVGTFLHTNSLELASLKLNSFHSLQIESGYVGIEVISPVL